MSPAVGVYPVADALTAGDEISSTYEGRHLTLREDELKHPVNAGGWVDKGDPVIICQAGVEANFGAAVGVAFNDGAAASDLIAVDTEGIWVLEVLANNDLGGSAVVPGDRLYINTTTCIISKINNSATQLPFGYALGRITATLSETIAVKVHWDPSLDNEARQWTTVTDGAYGRHKTAVFAGGTSEGLQYYDQRVTGAQTGGIYGWGTWMELAALFAPDGNLIVAHEIGIYDVGCGLNVNGRVVMQQMQAILANPPNTSFHWMRLNLAAAGGTATAVIAAANPNSVGYVADVVINAANKLGNVPLFDIVGVGVCFVEVFSV